MLLVTSYRCSLHLSHKFEVKSKIIRTLIVDLLILRTILMSGTMYFSWGSLGDNIGPA